ncbi:MAG TPA: YdeI/OmpD-associated family protein [Anaerolineaceae bacterium]|nr:YdeI/OmpD-associated family protein [Anaerolineaceae bacterium]
MTERNPKVDAFILNAKKWQDEFAALRELVLGSELTEELKWGVPCYTIGQKNVVLIHGFKEYCGMLFVKGALLKDPAGILIQQTENVQSARQVRFTNVQEIIALEPTLRSYIREAIENEKDGRKVELKATPEFSMPDEFRKRLENDPALKSAFERLTPGRQRAYLLHFSSPKQAATRETRIEKCLPLILAGKGLND